MHVYWWEAVTVMHCSALALLIRPIHVQYFTDISLSSHCWITVLCLFVGWLAGAGFRPPEAITACCGVANHVRCPGFYLASQDAECG